MDSKLQEIINASTFRVIDGIFIYAKVSDTPNLDDHFFVSKDEDEITVVTEENNLSKLEIIEKNKDRRNLIELNVAVPFYSVGFLAAVANKIAEEGMNILIISTYSKDYIMFRTDCLEKAKRTLFELGFKEKS